MYTDYVIVAVRPCWQVSCSVLVSISVIFHFKNGLGGLKDFGLYSQLVIINEMCFSET